MILLRHGQTDATGLCYGQSNPPLKEEPARTAAALRLPAWRRLVCSPSPRCLDLARQLAGHRPVRVSPALMELNFGQWEQRLWDEVEASHIEEWAKAPLDFCVPGGESARDLHRRVACWARSFQPGSGDLIVAHAGSLRALAAVLLKTDFETTWQWPLPYATPVVLTEITAGFVPYEANNG